MQQSLANVLIHFIFSTKNRTPWLNTPDIRTEMNSYLASVLKTAGAP